MQNYDASSAGLIFAVLGMIMVPLFIVFLIVIISHWKIYQKAGKPGWATIIPIYNVIVLLEIVGKPVWWIILLLIPVVNLIFFIWITNLLSKSFGQGEGFTLGLLLLPFIFYPVLAFGRFSYLGPAGQAFNPIDPSLEYQNPA